MEKKFFDIEIKATDEASRTFEGYGSVFNNVDRGGDIVAPTAFAKSIASKKPVMLFQHDPNKVIGVWDEISTDEHGLKMKGRFVDTALGNEVYTLVKEKAVSGLSVGYRTTDYEYNADGHRLLKEVDLWEVSVVTFPMNVEATIDAVKAAGMSKKEVEETLRDAGFSRSVAKALIAGGYDAISPREAENEAKHIMMSDLAEIIGQRFK